VASNEFILTRHRLNYIPRLSVPEDFLSLGFMAGCSMANCNAECCRYGVFVDVRERDKILAHAAIIQRYLEPHQEHDANNWFDKNGIDDVDFPSGKAVGTQARPYGCVFLNSSGKCALQVAAIAEGMDRFALKPFYCVAYPIVIENGVLMLDNGQGIDRPQCCTSGGLHDRSIFNVCGEELEFVLGKEGMEELQTAMGVISPSK
jgi:hypothetical protein